MSGDGGCAPLVVSISPKPVRESKSDLTLQSENPKKTKLYSIVQQSFLAKEAAFWQQYGITTEILKTYKVVSLKEFKSENSEGKPFTFTALDSKPVFGYVEINK
jgi:hypothetical protein